MRQLCQHFALFRATQLKLTQSRTHTNTCTHTVLCREKHKQQVVNFVVYLVRFHSLRFGTVSRSRFSGAALEIRAHGYGHYVGQYNIDKLRGGRISDSSYYLVQRTG